jgi:hypothetical protein
MVGRSSDLPLLGRGLLPLHTPATSHRRRREIPLFRSSIMAIHRRRRHAQYRFSNDPQSPTNLPFVDARLGLWNVPNIHNGVDAFRIGYQWSSDFAQFISKNRFYVGSGLMYSIARCMHLNRFDKQTPFAIGFFCGLEEVISAGALCHAKRRRKGPSVSRNPS